LSFNDRGHERSPEGDRRASSREGGAYDHLVARNVDVDVDVDNGNERYLRGYGRFLLLGTGSRRALDPIHRAVRK
jgi:hypothetical protein